MLVLVKTPAACLLIILYMVGFYYRKPHIPVKSTRIFRCLILVAIVNSIFDLLTVYTVNRREIVPDLFNYIAHVIYLLSILAFVYLLFLYTRSYLESEIKFTGMIKILHILPVMASTVGIFVLPITYVHGKNTDYSLGPKAYALYASLVVYLILILYYCLHYWKLLDKDKRLAIVLAVPIYIVAALIQMMIPESLIVVICSTLILLGLILSNENMEKYLDEKSMLFNQYSFEKVLEEFDFDKQKLVTGVLCFCETENYLNWKRDVRIFNDVYRGLRQYYLQGYRVGENGVAFISSTREKAETVLKLLRNSIEKNDDQEMISIETKVLSGDSMADKYSCMQSVLAFCTEVGSRIAYIDYLTNIYNRNALERDLSMLQEQENTCYFIADLNGLKLVNDTIGHSAGDKLLQNFARLLFETVGEDGRAYRQGGDEFAVLYDKDAQKLVQDLEKNCQIYNQSSMYPVSYAIGYCMLTDNDFRNVADQMMYEDKRKKKARR